MSVSGPNERGRQRQDKTEGEGDSGVRDRDRDRGRERDKPRDRGPDEDYTPQEILPFPDPLDPYASDKLPEIHHEVIEEVEDPSPDDG